MSRLASLLDWEALCDVHLTQVINLARWEPTELPTASHPMQVSSSEGSEFLGAPQPLVQTKRHPLQLHDIHLGTHIRHENS